MRSKHVIPAAGLDVDELIFGRHFANGSQLDAIGLAIGRAHLRGIPSKLLPANAGKQTPPQDLVLRFTRFTPDPSTIGSPCSREPTR